jgi:hypothetical protein
VEEVARRAKTDKRVGRKPGHSFAAEQARRPEAEEEAEKGEEESEVELLAEGECRDGSEDDDEPEPDFDDPDRPTPRADARRRRKSPKRDEKRLDRYRIKWSAVHPHLPQRRRTDRSLSRVVVFLSSLFQRLRFSHLLFVVPPSRVV